MEIKLSKQATKYIRKQDAKTVRKILLAIEGLKNKPYKGDITNLTGREEELRLVVANFRVVFMEIDNEIHILRIGPRGDVYKK